MTFFFFSLLHFWQWMIYSLISKCKSSFTHFGFYLPYSPVPEVLDSLHFGMKWLDCIAETMVMVPFLIIFNCSHLDFYKSHKIDPLTLGSVLLQTMRQIPIKLILQILSLIKPWRTYLKLCSYLSNINCFDCLISFLDHGLFLLSHSYSNIQQFQYSIQITGLNGQIFFSFFCATELLLY